MVTAWFCRSEFIWMLMLAGLHKAMSKKPRNVTIDFIDLSKQNFALSFDR
jgi:hypothetical protein